jgi:hypothetical protein
MFNIKWFVLLSSLLVFALPTWAIEDNLQIVGGDEDAIRELLEFYMRDMSPPDTETTIYVGQLPNELDIDLPTPEGRVIGSITREGPYANTEIIMVADESFETTNTFFQTEMEALGWEQLGTNFGQRGFVVEETSYTDFCHDEQDKFVNLSLRQLDDNTQVRININQADPYMCNQASSMDQAYQNDPYLRLPKLTTPEGVTMLANRGGGGGGGGYPGTLFSATSTWLVSKTLSLTDLMEAYDLQLEDMGWELISTESGEHTSLSLWQFEDGESIWSGYFSLMESATVDGQYYATIMVEQINE